MVRERKEFYEYVSGLSELDETLLLDILVYRRYVKLSEAQKKKIEEELHK